MIDEEIFTVLDVSWIKIMQVVEAVSHGCDNIEQIIKYCKTSSTKIVSQSDRQYIGRAIKMSEQLRFITIRNDEISLAEGLLPTNIYNLSREDQKILFRSHLQKYPPFSKFFHFLRLGISPQEAGKRICAIYNIQRRSNNVTKILKKWGTDAGIFVRKGDTIGIIEELTHITPSSLWLLLESLNNQLKAREYIFQILEDEVIETLEEPQLDDLVNAIVGIPEDPNISIQKAGKTLEDYLRIVAQYRGISLKGSGISQIVDELREHKIIASKHVNILKGLEVFMEQNVLKGLGTFRNMAGHGIDKAENMRWQLSEELATTYILQCLLAIKSIWFYVYQSKLIY